MENRVVISPSGRSSYLWVELDQVDLDSVLQSSHPARFQLRPWNSGKLVDLLWTGQDYVVTSARFVEALRATANESLTSTADDSALQPKEPALDLSNLAIIPLTIKRKRSADVTGYSLIAFAPRSSPPSASQSPSSTSPSSSLPEPEQHHVPNTVRPFPPSRSQSDSWSVPEFLADELKRQGLTGIDFRNESEYLDALGQQDSDSEEIADLPVMFGRNTFTISSSDSPSLYSLVFTRSLSLSFALQPDESLLGTTLDGSEHVLLSDLEVLSDATYPINVFFSDAEEDGSPLLSVEHFISDTAYPIEVTFQASTPQS